MNQPRRRATYDDVLNAPENVVAEIIDGELITTPRPAAPHALATSVIGADLIGAFGPPDNPGAPVRWWILFEPELHLGEDVVVPDLAGWRGERLPDVPATAVIELRPDWVCEVVSPRTGTIDRGRKMQIYARERIPHLWIVDPIARTLEVYRLAESGHWIVASTHVGDETARAEPFEEVELRIARWWTNSVAR
jgi:Uma2 family endonuclease